MKALLLVIAGMTLLAWWSPEWLPPLPRSGDVIATPAEHVSGQRMVIASDDDAQCYLNAVATARDGFAGERFRFLIDTGSAAVAFGSQHVRQLGISPASLRYNFAISTANGTARAASIRLRELRIGEFVLRDVPAFIDQKLDVPLLGAAVLKLLSLEFGKGFCAVTLPNQSANAAAGTVSRRRKG